MFKLHLRHKCACKIWKQYHFKLTDTLGVWLAVSNIKKKAHYVVHISRCFTLTARIKESYTQLEHYKNSSNVQTNKCIHHICFYCWSVLIKQRHNSLGMNVASSSARTLYLHPLLSSRIHFSVKECEINRMARYLRTEKTAFRVSEAKECLLPSSSTSHRSPWVSVSGSSVISGTPFDLGRP